MHPEKVFLAFLKKNRTTLLNGPFLTALKIEPRRVSSFLFNTNFPDIPGIHFIDIERKG